MKRRTFLQRSLLSAGLLISGTFPLSALEAKKLQRLTILHTNDWHSRIEPFPMDGGRNQGLGGIARRAQMVQQIRKESEEVLLLDSGDIFQGTPYFNFYKGEPEMKLMSALGYDAATIGNHDFDAGVEGLHKVLPFASFPLVSSNYDFSDTVLHNQILKHKIFDKGGIKVGVFGLGIELEGLVAKEMYGNTRYIDPLRIANQTASFLKEEAGCHLVICLSHLGYRYGDSKISDVAIAPLTRNIDLILGGHTHTFMEAPDVRRNLDGKEVLIHQVGWAGILLGRIDVFFEHNFKKRCVTCSNQLVK